MREVKRKKGKGGGGEEEKGAEKKECFWVVRKHFQNVRSLYPEPDEDLEKELSIGFFSIYLCMRLFRRVKEE